MLSFILNNSLVEELRSLNSEFAKVAQEVSSVSEKEYQSIQRMALISTIGASTRIENAVLTNSEIDWLDQTLRSSGYSSAFTKEKHIILDKLSKDKQRSVEEVTGCRAVHEIIFERELTLYPLTETVIRGLHSELLQFYPPADYYIGRYKLAPNSVIEIDHSTKRERTVFQTADPGPLTEVAVRDLVAWYNEEIITNPWTIAVATELVYRFLAIHPFQDGNGRLGRALFILSLLHSKDENLRKIAPLISIDRQIEIHRPAYYAALRSCSGGIYKIDPAEYRIELFLSFMLKMIRAALKDVSFYRGRIKSINDLSPAATKIYEAFKESPGMKLQSGDICNLTGLPKRTVSYCLTTLCKASLLSRAGKGAGTRYQLIF